MLQSRPRDLTQMFSAASSRSWFMPTHHAIFAHGGLPARVGPSVVGFHKPKQPRVQHPNLGPQGCANQCYTHCQLRVNSPGRAPARQTGQHPNICYAAHPPPPHHIHQAHNNRAMPQQQCAADCIEQVHTLLNATYSVQQQQYSTHTPHPYDHRITPPTATAMHVCPSTISPSSPS
jgi:hypothetical protein